MKKISSTSPWWLQKSPRLLCIIGFVCLYAFSFVGQAAASTTPGGNLKDPVVRQVDIDQLAVVRIVTKIGGHLSVQFTSTSGSVQFPLTGGAYSLAVSGSGAFISAHGDILTADHVVNPPHDESMDDFLYQTASQDIADYINSHYTTNNGPVTPSDVVYYLENKSLPSTATYDTPTSKVYLNTAYGGQFAAQKIADLPDKVVGTVDKIEAESAFNQNDIAVIHTAGMNDTPSIQLDDSSTVSVQDNLTIIGFPGLADVNDAPSNLLTPSVNKVYVSALKTYDNNSPLLQVSGNVEHGDSGGPALDDNGKIVGIVSFGLYDPNETGSTSFLRASATAESLIEQAKVDTTPGSFQTAWSQAFNDYATSSNEPGHWHKVVQEFQGLFDKYSAFQGAMDYMTYAQDKASQEKAPNTGSSSAINTTSFLVVGFVLVALLIIGLVFFLLRRRRSPVQVVPGAGPAYGYYPQQQQPGAPVGYIPNAPGTYPPAPASYIHTATTGTYPPTPADYTSPHWYTHPTNPDSQVLQNGQAAQVPTAVVPETPHLVTPTPVMPVQSEQQAENALKIEESTPQGVVYPRPHEYQESAVEEHVQPREHEYIQASRQMEDEQGISATGASDETWSANRVPSTPLPASDAWPTFMEYATVAPAPEESSPRAENEGNALVGSADTTGATATPESITEVQPLVDAQTWLAQPEPVNSSEVQEVQPVQVDDLGTLEASAEVPVQSDAQLLPEAATERWHQPATQTPVEDEAPGAIEAQTSDDEHTLQAVPQNIATDTEGSEDRTLLVTPQNGQVQDEPTMRVPWNGSSPEVQASQESPMVVAPCGHSNTPEVRFCRVCGRPVRPLEQSRTE